MTKNLSLISFFITTILLINSRINLSAQNAFDQQLLFTSPATSWEREGLPIGNGRMGAMMMGGIKEEVIQFNEQSLWSGDNNWDGEYETGDRGFGSYRNFGELKISFNHETENEDYKRFLDLFDGVHQRSFNTGNVSYFSEAFASYPDQVMVFRYYNTQSGGLSGKLSLHSAQGAVTSAAAQQLVFSDTMANGLEYAAICRMINSGGSCRAEESYLSFENCDTLTLFLAARTNYAPNYSKAWRGLPPLPRLEEEIDAAEKIINFK